MTDRLIHDDELFDFFQKNQVPPSEYWAPYVKLILDEIKRAKLDGFGRTYNLTRGFGDAKAYPKDIIHPNRIPTRIERYLRYPWMFLPAEKIVTDFRNFQKTRKTYNLISHLLKDKPLVSAITSEVSPDCKRLGINRLYKIGSGHLPQSYFQGLFYYELINEILESQQTSTIQDAFDGNFMDIGGGYGPFVDSVSIFKKHYKIATHSINYLLDQFPVAYIGNQYLQFRHPSHLLKPLVSKRFNENAEIEEDKKLDGSFFRVIQNSATEALENLKIKMFFNSNSFQEMDEKQIRLYVKFMRRNKSKNSLLACFFYANQRNASDEKALSIFKNEFKFVGLSSLEAAGLVPGNMHLFEIT